MNYSKPSKYFTYFVANKIYGWAMSQYLAMDFKRLKQIEIDKFDLNLIS